MSKFIDSTLFAAIIAAIVSIVIAILSNRWTKINDEKKLNDEIKKQEKDNRLNALQNAVETLQNVKNELRYLNNNINAESSFEWEETKKTLRILSRTFDSNYSKLLPSLNNRESKIMHEIMHFLSNSIHDFNRLHFERGNLKKDKISQEIESFRAKISDIQNSLIDLRYDIIDED